MTLLLADPLLLTLLAALASTAWLVWRGTFRSWFGRPQRWTIVAWPAPLLVAVMPVLAHVAVWLLGRLGLVVGDGGVAGAAVYLLAYLVPLVLLSVWPPAWLLPPWARARLARLPPDAMLTETGAVAALQVRRGHGSAARWAWRVDGLAGQLWIDGGVLRFRSIGATVEQEAGPAPGDLDDDAIRELRFASGPELRLEPPRGGLWGRGLADVDLAQVDRISTRGLRPWARDGLLCIDVHGRRPLRLWVDELRRFAARLTVT